MANKEYGSDFELTANRKFLKDNSDGNLFLRSDVALFFSGRVALYNLLKEGIKSLKWNRLYVPSFYCHEVVLFIRDLPIEITYYEFNPFLDSVDKKFFWADTETSVAINVFYFGITKLNLSTFKNIVTIDDVTHRILEMKTSTADYCFGSLRKELPVPVGGFCSSPKKKPLPLSSYSLEAEEVSIQKLTAMYLKNLYLAGNIEDKLLLRNLYVEAEKKLYSPFTDSSISRTSKVILSQLDIEKILASKYENVSHALSILKKCNSFTFNIGKSEENVFGLVLECENSIVQLELKQYLIEKRIYPAVLWPYQNTQRDIEVENRILFVHLDYRYDISDIEVIVSHINEFKKK